MYSSMTFDAVLLSVLSIVVVQSSPDGAANVGSSVQSLRVLRYSVTEELPADSFVADIRSDYSRAPEVEVPLPQSTKIALRNPSQYFRFDQNASGGGILRTARPLDRETICPRRPSFCELTIDVSIRAAQLFNVIKVVIAIDDINDHAPEFPVSRFQITVPADSPVGTLFPLQAADDADSGRLGAVEYRLLDGVGGSDGGGLQQLFDLQITELVDGSHDVRLRLIGRLDHRLSSSSASQHHLTLVAFDGGSPPRSSSLAVSVTIERSTPVAVPRFDQSVYTARVAENQARRHPVVQVRAQLFSSDATGGRQVVLPSGQISYSLEPAEPGGISAARPLPFGVEPQTGLVYVRDNVDYETERVYRMTVVATHVGSTSRGSTGTSRVPGSASASLVIDVIDSNDNAPEVMVNALTRSGRAELPESATDGTFVAHLAVADLDGAGDNSRMKCSVTGSDSPFRLDQIASGSRPEYKLVTAGDRRFDRESVDSYRVVVTCRDHGVPPLTSTVVLPVDVLDENDNDPVFNEDFYVIRIGFPFLPSFNGTLVSLRASDRDAGPNAELRYRLDPVDPLLGIGLLTIDPLTGVIKTNQSAWTVDTFQPETVYRYVATVSDVGVQPRSSMASVLVRVVFESDDEKENSSTNHSDRYRFSIDCDQPIGSYIGRVLAEDVKRTSSIGKRSKFALQGSNTWFRIDSTTGDVYLSVSLENEITVPEVVEMIVLVDDDDAIAAVDSMSVMVAIRCSRLPRFLFPHPSNDTVRVNTSGLVGDDPIIVARPLVQSRPGSRLSYAIIAGNADGIFTIDPSIGFISAPTSAFSAPRRRFRLSLSVNDLDRMSEPSEGIADLRLVFYGGKRSEKEISEYGNGDGGAGVHDYVTEEAASGGPMLMGSLVNDWNVIVVMIACGGGVLLVVAIIVIAVVVRIRKKRTVKQINNYNCRIEAANKSRQQDDSNSGTESADDGGLSSNFNSLLRRPGSVHDVMVEDINCCSVIEDDSFLQTRRSRTATSTPLERRPEGSSSGRNFRHPSEQLEVDFEAIQLESPAAPVWALAGTHPSSSSPSALSTSVFQQPPSILKSSVKKEVKFCLNVSDDDGARRPLNGVHHKQAPAYDAIMYKAMTTPGCCPPSSNRLPLRSLLASEDDDDDVEGGSVGSGGSVTDSGRGASEEGDSTAVHASAAATTATPACAVIAGADFTRRQQAVAPVKDSEVGAHFQRGNTKTGVNVQSSTLPKTQTAASSSPDFFGPHFRSCAAPVSGGDDRALLFLTPPAPPALSTFRGDAAVLSQCALSLAADVPTAASASTVKWPPVHSAETPGAASTLTRSSMASSKTLPQRRSSPCGPRIIHGGRVADV